MKRFWFLVLTCIFSQGFFPGTARALEFRLFGGAGNHFFDPEGETPLGAGAARFTPHVFPLGIISLEGEFSDTMDFSAAYEWDPLLGNRLLGNVGFEVSVFRLDFGPFIGVFNTPEQALNPGIAAALALEFPGVIFGSLKAASTFGSPVFPGDYLQQTGEVALGFWVPYVVCTFSIATKGSTRQKTDDLLLKDEQIRYQFRADIFTKNVPYTIRIDMGYQSLKRSYHVPQTETSADELKSIYIGFEGSYRIIPSLRLILGAEMPVFVWGEAPLKGPEKNTLLYQLGAGVIWTLPQKKSTPSP
jgi:hypothetical protein